MLKNQGKVIYPFDHSLTDFAEEIEFNYAKLTRLVMNAWNQLQKKERLTCINRCGQGY